MVSRTGAALASLLLLGCGLSTRDLDGDGFAALDGDCDDWDPRVNPAAADLAADGVDDDCDGVEPIAVARGLEHACTLYTDGSIRCTGDDALGQLDVPPQQPFPFVDLVAGDYHSCALDLVGTTACWGDDREGQSTPPADLEPVERIGAGPDFSWGEGPDQPRVCWGRCFGP
ncbi:MAG: hypothetical protein ACI8PZ_005825 [Myxococcota bacterium]